MPPMPGRARGVFAMKFALSASLVALVMSISAGTPLLLAQESSKSKAKVEPPPVFKQASFKDALAETVGTDKILIVKGTAEWCGPCKQMDRTTWRDQKVVQWVKDNGLAIQVDVEPQDPRDADHDRVPERQGSGSHRGRAQRQGVARVGR
jgi:thiol:disulfide interchange protein